MTNKTVVGRVRSVTGDLVYFGLPIFTIVALVVGMVAVTVGATYTVAYTDFNNKLSDMKWQAKSAIMRGAVAEEAVATLRREVELLRQCVSPGEKDEIVWYGVSERANKGK